MQLLNKLIPGFQEKASATVDINALCVHVYIPRHLLNLITDMV